MAIVYLLLALIVSFIIARRLKDHRVYTRLVLCIFVGFVLGGFVKKQLATVNDDTTTSIVNQQITFPTFQTTSPKSTEESKLEMSQDSVSDNDLLDKYYILPYYKLTRNSPEIINDS